MGNVIDLAAARAAAALVVEPEPADSGLRVVVVSDPGVSDEEAGWHCYGPFDEQSAALVADDMRLALDDAGMAEVAVRLVPWQPWPAVGDGDVRAEP